MDKQDLKKLLDQAHDYGEPGIMPKGKIPPPCQEIHMTVEELQEAATKAANESQAVIIEGFLKRSKVWIFEEDDMIRFALIGRADFPLWSFWQEWWEKNILPSAGTSPYKEWNIRMAGTEAERQLRLELEARRATVQGLRKQFSMDWFGVEDKDWSEIIGKILEVEHGFETIPTSVEHIYPEAEW